MIYRIVTYDRTSERMRGSLVIPPAVLEKIKKIAGFRPQDDGLGDYPLDNVQVRKIGRILGFRADPGRFFYYVEPYDLPEDCGLEETAAATADC